jgi:DNA replication protein DnaC
VPFEHRWFGKAHPCICSVQKAQNTYVRWLWNESLIPAKFREATLRDFDVALPGNKAMIDTAWKYIMGGLESQWLFIHGGAGCGKTHVCAAIVRSFILREIPAVYAFVPDVLKSLQRGFENNEYFTLLDAWKKITVLALDDLGVQNDTTWIRAELEELVDYRYRNGLATIITSNLNIEDLGKLSFRIASRVQDRFLSTVINNTSPDYRLGVTA